MKDLVIGSMRREAPRYLDALTNVTFEVEAGSMLGIIGRNGSGKTTLLRVIAGILKQDSGRVEVTGRLSAVMALGTGLHPDLTGREGARIELLCMGFSRAETDSLLPSIQEFSGVGDLFDAPIRIFSTGMIMRLAFACAICVNPDVLLLDEVLAVGDEAFAAKCLEAIASFRRRGKTIVLATHAADVVEHFCDVALWLDGGHVAAFGDSRSVLNAYRAHHVQVPAPA